MTRYTAAHWGIYEVAENATGDVSLKGLATDPNPSEIGLHMLDASRDASVRVQKPAVREGWLKQYRSGTPETGVPRKRGSDRFIEVSWDEALDMVAHELDRVRKQHGNSSIFGGSYGWSSAGRFHHAQSQVHRFLNAIGGYVPHKDSYSLGAGRVILPYIIGTMDSLIASHTSWDQIIDHTELFVSFGGVPEKSAQVSPGGAGDHRVPSALKEARQKGVEFVNISPMSGGMDTGSNHTWLPIRPSTDTALMMAVAYWLHDNGKHDVDFLNRYTVGYNKFAAYLTGEKDGIPKTPAWAEKITGIAQQDIVDLAAKMASKRTMLNATWSLQRADHGEQPFWMLITLACMLGQIGLPGGGFGLGYGSANTQGSNAALFSGPTLDQGKNPVEEFIPVARIADLLLNPGELYPYRGELQPYADIRLVYWAGGNPFHHHQDLNRLVRAWQQPETIIVHEPYWTPTAHHADIVLPVTTTFERDDIAYSKRERYMAFMSKLYEPMGESKDDYSIFAMLAEKMGVNDVFSENRDSYQWMRAMYETSRERAGKSGINLPDYDTFTQQGLVDLHSLKSPEPVNMLSDFRQDPEQNPLTTASGKLEIFCETIHGYGLDDCMGHPAWYEPHEWLTTEAQADGWLHLLSDQPKTKLHSQLDHSKYSKQEKLHGREPVHMHAADAKARGLKAGDLVRLHNDRGSCLASVIIDNSLREGVIRQSTGAWFNPAAQTDANGGDRPQPLELHGNPNVLTRDQGTSSLSQGCSAYSCLVKIEPFTEVAPEVTAFRLPEFAVSES